MSYKTQDDFPKMGAMKKGAASPKAISGSPRELFPKNLPGVGAISKPSQAPAKAAKDPKISKKV